MAAGNPAQNRFGAANKLNNFLMCPMNALSTAIVSFNAQNLGAGRQDRIRRGTGKSLLIGLAMHLVLGGAGMLLTINGAYQYLFMSADKITAATIRCGNLYLYVDLSMYFALMILLVFRLGVQGVGHAEFALAAGCAELVARYLLGGAHKKPSGNDWKSVLAAWTGRADDFAGARAVDKRSAAIYYTMGGCVPAGSQAKSLTAVFVPAEA